MDRRELIKLGTGAMVSSLTSAAVLAAPAARGDAEGRRGGLFLSRRSAVRFAREESEPAGCALMFLKGRLELDVMTDGVSGSFAAVVRAAEDRAPMLAALASALLTHWHGFVETISRALAGQRRNRAAIEQELFRGQYTLSSKSDDDLPVVD